MATEEHERAHDIVVFGATGFVGRLTAAYLAEHAPDDVTIALGGRSRQKLEATRAELGPGVADWPLIVADCHDEEAMAQLAGSTRVVVTTVGPYHAYGLPLVQACAAAGTHYADLTGEVLFMRRSIDAAHDAAQASGAKIVHTCGFDSIPSDLACPARCTSTRRQSGAGELEDTTLVVNGMQWRHQRWNDRLPARASSTRRGPTRRAAS